MDGIKCKLGATHLPLAESMQRYRAMNPHVGQKTRAIVRERLPIKRERLPVQGRLF